MIFKRLPTDSDSSHHGHLKYIYRATYKIWVVGIFNVFGEKFTEMLRQFLHFLPFLKIAARKAVLNKPVLKSSLSSIILALFKSSEVQVRIELNEFYRLMLILSKLGEN